MVSINRRNFLKLGTAVTAALSIGKGALKANAWDLPIKGGKDFSPMTGKERKAIPSACWSCVTRDSMIGYVEDDQPCI
jgi:anaerobic selenocysteine-containing dehydrogenase